MGAGRSWLGGVGTHTHTHTSMSGSTVTSGQSDALMIRRASKTSFAHWLRLRSVSPVCLLQTRLCVKSIVPMWRDDRLQPIWLWALNGPISSDVPALHKHWDTHTQCATALSLPASWSQSDANVPLTSWSLQTLLKSQHTFFAIASEYTLNVYFQKRYTMCNISTTFSFFLEENS